MHRGERGEEERHGDDRVPRIVGPGERQRVDRQRGGERDAEAARHRRLACARCALGLELCLAALGDSQAPREQAAGDHAVERDEQEVGLVADLDREPQRR